MKHMDLRTFVVTPFAQNMRVGFERNGSELLIVDPGGDVECVLPLLREHKPNLVHIFLTHSHLDHAGGVAALIQLLKDEGNPQVKTYGSIIERSMRANLPRQAQMFGLGADEFPACPEPDTYLQGGERVTLLGVEWQIAFTPGHSPGHLTLYAAPNANVEWHIVEAQNNRALAGAGVLIAGDVLFMEGIGRTDLPGGDHQALLKSIREHCLTLPDDTIVLSGHGPSTTIGHERNSNPFL